MGYSPRGCKESDLTEQLSTLTRYPQVTWNGNVFQKAISLLSLFTSIQRRFYHMRCNFLPWKNPNGFSTSSCQSQHWRLLTLHRVKLLTHTHKKPTLGRMPVCAISKEKEKLIPPDKCIIDYGLTCNAVSCFFFYDVESETKEDPGLLGTKPFLWCPLLNLRQEISFILPPWASRNPKGRVPAVVNQGKRGVRQGRNRQRKQCSLGAGVRFLPKDDTWRYL